MTGEMIRIDLGPQNVHPVFLRMEHSKSELDLGYTEQGGRRSQWEDWEGWNPPSHHSGHYPDDWARYDATRAILNENDLIYQTGV